VILNILQPYGLPRPVTGIALLLLFLLYSYNAIKCKKHFRLQGISNKKSSACWKRGNVAVGKIAKKREREREKEKKKRKEKKRKEKTILSAKNLEGIPHASTELC
jgi:hypothetical protein